MYADTTTDPDESENIYDETDPELIALWDILLPYMSQIDTARVGSEPVNPGP